MIFMLSLLLGAQQFGFPDLAYRSTITHPNWASDFGRCVTILGDLDGDLIDDYSVTTNQNSGSDLYVYSGATGNLLFQPLVAFSYGPTQHSVAAAGDMNADNIPDIFVRDGGGAALFSGADGTTIWRRSLAGYGRPGIARFADFNGDLIPDCVASSTNSAVILSGLDGSILKVIPTPPGLSQEFASAIHASGDANGDGMPDILIGDGDDNGEVALFDGVDGSFIRKHGISAAPVKGEVFSWISDLNGDGCSDYALIEDWHSGYGDSIVIFSGRSGMKLMTRHPHQLDIQTVGEIGDIDKDGRPELAVAGGRMVIYSLPSGRPRWELRSSVSASPIVSFSGPATFDQHSEPDLLIGLPGTIGADYPPSGYGSVELFAGLQNPIITSDSSSVSVSLGGRVDLHLDFEDLQGFWYDYRLLVSTAPGITNMAGITVPLAPTRALHWTSHGHYPGFIHEPEAGLDVYGDADPFFDLLPGEGAAWLGRTVWLAAISFKPGQHGGVAEWGTASSAIPLTFNQ